VDAATKAGLLVLLDQATEQGWTVRAACGVLELGELRTWRWLARRGADQLADHASGGNPVHGLLDWEVAEILALFDEWGQTDRSHRKLAHRGSYLNRVWVSPPACSGSWTPTGCACDPGPGPPDRPGAVPEWACYRPGSIWIYDTTHFTRAKMAVTAIEDLVSRKWLGEIVSAEETSTQVQAVFCDALEAEGLMGQVAARLDGTPDLGVDDDRRPILLAMSLIHPEWRADRACGVRPAA
jgi:hypothetical protein